MSGRIVVGVDGSDGSKDALRWAIEEARIRDAELIALHAWTVHYVGGDLPFGGVAVPEIDWRANAQEVLDSTVDPIQATTDVPIQKRLVERPPAQALIRASEDADLLVVGSRGRGAFTGMLLGSVSQHCTHHAKCTVVIVRET